MSQEIRLESLSEKNFSDYEKLTQKESNGKSGCYCAFWHQKWNSMEEWERRQKEEPLKNRDIVKSRMQSGFHVGVLAYVGNELLGWISVGPLPEFYWTWRRVAQVAEAAPTIAGITCINVAESFRKKGFQEKMLSALAAYAKEQKWTVVEGYPFDPEAHRIHGEKVLWAGFTQSFERAGFERVSAHWLNHDQWPRSIYRLTV